MKTLIHASEKKVWESFDNNDVLHDETETIKQKPDLQSQKSFRVVDLWKIRSMKKYFNY